MSYAQEQERFEDKVDQLFDWVNNTGEGIMGVPFGEIPNECLEFCNQQYARFNVPYTDEIAEVVIAGASAAFHYVDAVDPYCLFWEISDVNITSDWCKNAYEILDDEGRVIHEAEPEFTETFSFVPGQAERVFDYIMSHPGLDAIPNAVGMGLRDILNGNYNGDEMYDSISGDADRALKALCTDTLGPNIRKYEAYFELAAWGAFAWLAGPLGRAFRHKYHIIFQEALDHGEALLLDGTVYSPKSYRKLLRAAKSCYRCGNTAWCIELTCLDSGTKYVCEHCASGGVIGLSFASCGTKLCRDSGCRHHPFFARGAAGIYNAAVQHGQLRAMGMGLGTLRSAPPKFAITS
jgi:hypothetical protein